MPRIWEQVLNATQSGYQMVPNVFIKHFVEIGITQEEAILIIYLLMFDYGDIDPYPGVYGMAKSLGKNEKTIRLTIASLRSKGILRTTQVNGKTNFYDLSPLIEKLRPWTNNTVTVEMNKDGTGSVGGGSVRRMEIRGDTEPSSGPYPNFTVNPGKITRGRGGLPEIRVGGGTRISGTEEDRGVEKNREKNLPSEDAAHLNLSLGILRDRSEEDSKKPQLKSRLASVHSMFQERVAKAEKVAATRRPLSGSSRASGWTGAKRREQYEAKKPEEYHANDLELVLRDSWEKHGGWKTRPPVFTMKDRKQAKDLIEQYGAAETAKVVQTVVAKWEDFSSRYNLNGLPSIGVVYGFRRSFFPEVLDGRAQKGNHVWGGNYDPEKDDLPPDQVVGWTQAFQDELARGHEEDERRIAESDAKWKAYLEAEAARCTVDL